MHDPRCPPYNQILAGLPAHEWAELRPHATRVQLPARHSLSRVGERPSGLYFPETGLISVVSTLESGHQVQVAAIGRNGLIGASVILDMPFVPYWMVVEIDSTGYSVPGTPFIECFRLCDVLRQRSLHFIGEALQEVGRSAACNRFHSHRERLARWLLISSERSGERTLALTHDFIAQMVGGPRHAVTAALQDLRDRGGITYERGRVEVVDATVLAACACECYVAARADQSAE